jgi:hypothetical protein
MSKVIIVAKAEFWESRFAPEKIDLKIEKTDDEIRVNGEPATMEFNGLQLRLKTKERIYILFDGRTGSNLSIEEMHQQLG